MNSIANGPHFRGRSRTEDGMRFRGLGGWFALVAMLLALTPLLRAQENATINGTVTDASGAVVANAQLTLTNTATGQIRNEVSNSVGAYRFGNVGIGTYTLDATASGFQKYTKTGIVVNVASTLEEDISSEGRQRHSDRRRSGRGSADPDGNQRSEHPDQRPAGGTAFHQRQ